MTKTVWHFSTRNKPVVIILINGRPYLIGVSFILTLFPFYTRRDSTGALEMAQWIKRSSCKHEDRSSYPQNPQKRNAGMAACNPNPGEGDKVAGIDKPQGQ